MGARAKNNPPRRRGPKPEVLVQPGPRVDSVAKSLKQKGPEVGWPKPHSKDRGK